MKCWLVILLLPLVIASVAQKKCTKEEEVNMEKCTQIITRSENSTEQTIDDTKMICEKGRKCFEEITCDDAIRYRETLKAGCDYDIFLSTDFAKCREIIKSKTNCMETSYNQTIQPCEMFKSMLECVLPAIREKCGSETLGEIFEQKFKHHNNLSFQCGI